MCTAHLPKELTESYSSGITLERKRWGKVFVCGASVNSDNQSVLYNVDGNPSNVWLLGYSLTLCSKCFPDGKVHNHNMVSLLKALEAGNYNAAPTDLKQGTGCYYVPYVPSKTVILTNILAPTCECGSASVGSPNHSSYCPCCK